MKSTIWITGASRGIGLALTEYYLQQGHNVVASARDCRSLEPLQQQFAAQLQLQPLDITDAKAVQRLVVTLFDHHSPQPVLAILNAGTHQAEKAGNFRSDTVRNLVELNLLGTCNCIEALLPLMRTAAHQGSQQQLAVVASLAGYRGLPEAAAYGASKAALINLVESLAVELYQEPLDIRLINPGFVKTPLTELNDFPMPDLISARQAAEKIAAGLAGSAFEIRFPWRFATLMALLRQLHARLYLPLIHRATRRNR
ncbi:MAG: SDR family NAD(P)-dependent oxidoreductase [Marinobacterium sp.]|nr:SDR family NAD(P)-dependent oxidoreductase [Marinobacterium sp.]